MASSTTATSQHILREIGGADNVSSLTHCATRLRFQLHDQDRVDVEKLESDPAVLGVVKQGATGLQVVMGGGVADYYNALIKQPGLGGGGNSAGKPGTGGKDYGGVRGKYSFVDYCFEFLSDTFRPVLWALLGASLIITILVVLDTTGVQDFRAPMAEQPPTFQFLHAMWRSVFYFLPIFIGATAAKKLGANEWVGAAIPAALFTPEFLGMREVAEQLPTAIEGQYTYQTHIFGLPLVIQDYGGQVFPPIFAAIILFFLEKGLKKVIPAAVQMVFVPFISLLIMIPLTALVVGPFGIGIGNGIANFLFWVNDLSPFILAVVIPLLYPFLVPLGLHWPLNAIMIVNIATLGYDFIQGPMGAWNFACFGVVTGVMVISIMERNTQMRQVAAGGMFAGLLGGISEPSLYGVLLRFRKTYFRLLPGCLAGGIVMGFFNVKAYAFVFTSLLTIPVFDSWWGYTIGIAVAFGVSFFLTVALDYRGKEEKAEIRAQLAAAREPAPASSAPGALVIGSPLAGRAIPLADAPDPAFASGALGLGVAIEPTGGEVVAPADATVLTIQKTGHAVGLRLDNGVDLLIHVGVDTVGMGGAGFETFVEKRQRVTKGTRLIAFDRAAIEAAGHPAVTMVLVANTKSFESVTGVSGGELAIGDPAIEVAAKETVPA